MALKNDITHKRSALIIGIDRYEDPVINDLKCAENDATELFAFFKHIAKYDNVQILRRITSEKVVDTAAQMVKELKKGDLLLFYFAGHGVEHENRHLLLCPEVKYSRLRYLQQTVPVDLLRQETEKPGMDRVFILDTCRSNLLSTRDPKGQGLKGETILRDVVGASTLSTGSFAMLCSCAEGQQAGEIVTLGHGLFTTALINILQEAVDKGTEVGLSDRMESSLSDRMSQVAKKYGLPLGQTPWIQRKGPPPVLFPGQRIPHSGKIELLESPRLKVETTPSGCSISIDGKSFGLSPLSIPLSAGNYNIRAEKIGFKPWNRIISFDGKGDGTVEIELREKSQPQEEEVKPIQQEIRKWVRDNDAEWTKEQWKDFVLELYDSGIASGFSKKHLAQWRDQEKKVWLAEKKRRLEEEKRRKEEEKRRADELRRIQLQEEKHRKEEEKRRADELRRIQLKEEKRAGELRRIDGEKLWLQIKEAPNRRLCREYLAKYSDGRFKKKVQDVLGRLEDEQKWRREKHEKIIRPILPVVKLISILVIDIVILAAIILFLKLSNNPLSSLSNVHKVLLFIYFVEITLLNTVLHWKAKRFYQLAERTFSSIGIGLFLLIPFILFALLLADFTTGLIVTLSWGLILFLPVLPLLRWICVFLESLVVMSCIILFLNWQIGSFWPVNNVNKFLLFVLFGEISLICVGLFRNVSEIILALVGSICLIVLTLFPLILVTLFSKEWYQATIGLIASIVLGLVTSGISFVEEPWNP